MFRSFVLPAIAAAALAQPHTAHAADEPVLRLQLSPYTLHRSNETHHTNVLLAGLELERNGGTLHGFAVFRNSFGQGSAYVYPWGGVYRDVFGVDRLFVKWTVGVVYGYRHPYEHKIPLNYHGFAPAIIPGIGWSFDHGFSTQINLLGVNALMFQISKDL